MNVFTVYCEQKVGHDHYVTFDTIFLKSFTEV